MNPRILPSHKEIFTVFFFFFWILCLVVGSPVLAATIGSGDCQPQRCGNHTIKYPFWLSNKQPSYCGFPPFNVTCISSGGQAETLSFNVFDGLYHVKNIFYENKSVQLNAAGFDDDRCPLPTFNITSGLYPFDLSSANKRIFFLSNCSSSMNLSAFQNISCAADGGLSYFGGEYNGSGKLNFSGGVCKLLVVPVVGYIDVGIDVNYSALLRTGWLLNWTAPDCTECSDSGGRCGFNDTTTKFMCICPDQVHTRKCEIVLDVAAHSRRTKHIIIVFASFGGLLLCLCVFLLIYYKKSHEGNVQSAEALLNMHGSLSPKRYKYSEIKRMTRSFSHKLGHGGYGTVYKGTLQDGRSVAVKLLTASKGNGEEFINEVVSISRTSHVNIVSLLGFCLEGSKRALVYEFMPNGSLEKFIYAEDSETRTPIGLEKLYDISVGIARGLEYLHRGCNTRIVHFDIKPHNILLDQDFCPKISDFGLAKLGSPKESILSMAAPRGTVGYIAPEVFSRNFGAVSSKADVYSYGMMVLEMVGGRKNIDAAVESTNEIYFPHWIYDRLDGKNEIDISGLNSENEETVRKMIIVGLWCIQMMPGNRPSMSEIVDMLEGSIKDLQMPPRP
ncbi:LEAF RUST 10 DISEASE-RESISTANCE LOCUS RECEPTOR-LIKE PROTEIN KINASE-like 2.1 isoform X1 [Musa acuminata AAA Group]|uniref:LEAF RUST 10 DISEASE-RESISTANCE LOCUS RECEPTOR-LIKE PROTEIN KINASE-like 2.1 isoform X1 n=1 Tax=Musa acuminata AAA Group TaxID=214697 RepID=UPI0031D44287